MATLVVVMVALSACRSETDSDAGAPTTGGSTRAVAAALEDLVADRPDDEPGCGVGVARGDDQIRVAFGRADLARGIPIDDETVFDLASNSKQFTGAAVVLLAAEGRLSLDDTVAEYVPPMAAYPGSVTIGQLLHHTSGIPDYLDALQEAHREDRTVTQGDTVALIATLSPDASPGGEFAYSNSNYVLLAEIVEAAGGRPFAEFVEAELFEPAGMTSALVHDYVAKVPHLAFSYGDGPKPLRTRWQQRGDGAVHATVGDLLRWGAHVIDAKAGTRPLLEGMAKGAVEAREDTYGAGLYVRSVGGHRALMHDGSWLGFESQFVVVPDARVTAVVLCNRTEAGSEDLLYEVVDLVLAEP